MNLTTPLGRLRLLAILEGISYLLFAVTMPLKYVYDITQPNYYVGMAHGILFIGYIAFSLQCIYLFKWNFGKSLLVLAASLIPFGTFVADKKIFAKEKAAVA